MLKIPSFSFPKFPPSPVKRCAPVFPGRCSHSIPILRLSIEAEFPSQRTEAQGLGALHDTKLDPRLSRSHGGEGGETLRKAFLVVVR